MFGRKYRPERLLKDAILEEVEIRTVDLPLFC